MTGPRRLVEEGDEFERRVLESARLDVASDDGLKRTLVAVGAGAVALSATASTAGASAAGSAGVGAAAGAAGGGLTLLGGVGAGAFVKWVGVATVVVGAGTALTTATLAQRRSHLRAPPQSAVLERAPAADRSTGATSPPGADPLATSSMLRDSTDPARSPGVADRPSVVDQDPLCRAQLPLPEPSRNASPANVTPATVHPRVAPDRGPSAGPAAVLPVGSGPWPGPPSILETEVATLDRVWRFLDKRDAARALEALDAYDRSYPNSVLAQEATVLRVDALVEIGDRADAEALAARFLLANPASPHASHLRQLLAAHNLRSFRAPRGI